MKRAFFVVLSLLVLIGVLIAGNIHWKNKIADAGKGTSAANISMDTTSDSTDNQEETSTEEASEDENTDEEPAAYKEITATDDAWNYSGHWEEATVEEWGTVMQGTLQSTGAPAYGRKATIATNSSFATLKQRQTGGTVAIYVDGKLMTKEELADDGTEKEIEIWKDNADWHEIDIQYSNNAEISALHVANDAEVRQPEPSEEKLVVIGHNYGVPPTDPTRSFTSLLEEQLGMETVNQGIPGTDLDVSNPEDEENSGLNRVVDDVVNEDPTAVLVVYGKNALAASEGFMDYGAYYEEYVNFLQEIRTELPDVPIFISGVISNPSLIEENINRLNQNILAVTWEIPNTSYIDLYGQWNQSNYTTYYADENFVNLSTEGHQFIADQYTQAINAYLNN